MTPTLRVVDAGVVGALRSQALWHGLADSMAAGDEPVLSFCRPGEPYVSVGYHRRLDELDPAACRELGIPVLRRQIGGGPVYLDADQLFFQLTLPAADAPAAVATLYERLLGPAAAALRALGVPARVAGTNDIVAAGRKVSGTGAGRIGDGVVVVGNVMFAFPHERMAHVLAVPDPEMRAECLRLMRAHVGALPALDERATKDALVAAYAQALGREPRPAALGAHEEEAVGRWERRLADPAWTAGPALPAPAGRQVKVRAGTWVYAGAREDVRVRVTVEDGRIAAARVHNGDPAADDLLAGALVGVVAERPALAEALVDHGEHGERVLEALAPGLVVR